jgi:hypothetical protein
MESTVSEPEEEEVVDEGFVEEVDEEVEALFEVFPMVVRKAISAGSLRLASFSSGLLGFFLIRIFSVLV